MIVLAASTVRHKGVKTIIKSRQTLMKRSGDMAKLGASTTAAKRPFDLAKAKEIFAAFADNGSETADLLSRLLKDGRRYARGLRPI